MRHVAHGAPRLDRRGFLKRTGLGSAAVASIAALGAVPTPVWADGNETAFIFAAQSRATIGGETHLVLMGGRGRIGSKDVEGGGSFNQFKLIDGIPRPLVAAGTWRTRRLVSFNPIGTYGVFTAGILIMEIELISEIPGKAQARATLEVVCNIGAAGLSTGEDEGFILTVPGVARFEPFGAGITLFPAARPENGD